MGKTITSILSLLALFKSVAALGSPEHPNPNFGRVPFDELEFQSPEFRRHVESMENHDSHHVGSHVGYGNDFNGYPIEPYPSNLFSASSYSAMPYSSHNAMDDLSKSFSQGMHFEHSTTSHPQSSSLGYDGPYQFMAGDGYNGQAHHGAMDQGNFGEGTSRYIHDHEQGQQYGDYTGSVSQSKRDQRAQAISHLSQLWRMKKSDVAARLNNIDHDTLESLIPALLSNNGNMETTAETLFLLSVPDHEHSPEQGGKGSKKPKQSKGQRSNRGHRRASQPTYRGQMRSQPEYDPDEVTSYRRPTPPGTPQRSGSP